MFLVIFKTESQVGKRLYFCRPCDTPEEACTEREKIINEGVMGEKVVYTCIKEGEI